MARIPKVTKDIQVLGGEDWVGVYVNGRLALEDHPDRAIDQPLHAMGIGYELTVPEMEEYLEETGRCPKTLSEIGL